MNGIHEVVGSIPISSTRNFNGSAALQLAHFSFRLLQGAERLIFKKEDQTMKSRSIGLAITLCTLLACSVAVAEERVKSIPDLVGTWTGEKKIYYQKGERRSTSELRISEQDGAYFRGYRIWQHTRTEKEPLGNVGGKHVHQASEPILGIIGFDFKTIYMVEHDDWAHLHARLVDSDTMEVIYLESGPNAAVFRVTLKRKR